MSSISGDAWVSAAAVVIIGLIGYSTKQSIGRVVDRLIAMDAKITELSERLDDEVDEVCGDLQDHKVRCHADSNAVIASRVSTNEREIASLRKFAHWTSNCLQVLFQKTPGAVVPPRND